MDFFFLTKDRDIDVAKWSIGKSHNMKGKE